MGQISQVNITTPSGQIVFNDNEMGGTGNGVSSPGSVSTGSATVFYVTVDNSLNIEPIYLLIFNASIGDVVLGSTAADDVLFCQGSVGSPLPGSAITTVVYLTLNGSMPGKMYSTAVTAAVSTVANGAGTGPKNPVSVTIGYVGNGGGGSFFF
jgi:hypothetical protein